MELNTLSKYSENTRTSFEAKQILTSTIIPVEVFVIFIGFNQESFTVNQVISLFEQRHKIKLSFSRAQQILQDLVSAHKLKTHQALNKKNHLVNYYTFKSIL